LAVRDSKDEPILASGLGGRADYLVTGDKDQLVLAGDPGLGTLKIVTVTEFLAVLAQRASGEAGNEGRSAPNGEGSPGRDGGK
jgi:predicted nucleic acid-binding protein